MAGRQLWIGPSALEDHQLCARKWFFKKRLKLPEIEREATAVGSVVHALLKRWLSADEHGMLGGEPLDLYAEGWDVTEDKQGNDVKLNSADADLVRRLVDKAIKEGVVERLPNRIIEANMKRPFNAGTREEPLDVMLVGRIDVQLPEAIHDHKTTKNTRYILSKKKMPNDLALNFYAGEVLFDRLSRQEPLPKTITLRHNNFVKDRKDPRIRVNEVEVSPDHVQEQWSTNIVPEIQKVSKTAQAKKWNEIPDPAEGTDACNAFGGCPFISICTGRESCEQYTSRINSLNEGEPEQTKGAQEPMSTEAFKKRLEAAKAGTTPPPAAAPPAEAPTAAPAAQPEATPTPANTQKAPWATADCKACAGTGINSKGNPCRICDSIQKKNNGITSSMYAVEVDGSGALLWEVLPEYAEIVAHQGAGGAPLDEGPTPEVKKEVREMSPAERLAAAAGTPAPEKVEATPVVTPQPPVEKPTQDTGAGTGVTEEKQLTFAGLELPDQGFGLGKKKPGRPRVTFTLLIGCMVVKGANDVILVEDVLATYGEHLAKSKGVPSYWMLDAFERRDILRAVVPKIVEELQGHAVVSSGDDPDTRALVDALRHHASTIVEPRSGGR